MDQAVQVYDDAAARDTALPSPLQGQLVYLKDSDAVQKYNGASFVPVGGLVATKSALKTDTFTSSVTSANNVAVTGLSITHALQNANNKLIISAYFGTAGSSDGRGNIGIGVMDGSTFIGVGDAAGSRQRVGAGGVTNPSANANNITTPSVTFVYQPADTTSRTYTIRAINILDSTATLFVNRSEDDSNTAFYPRGSSGLVIQEVAV
jgi:hypothetical protein